MMGLADSGSGFRQNGHFSSWRGCGLNEVLVWRSVVEM